MSNSAEELNQRPRASWREQWYEIIFEADTPAGKLFDVVLLIAIMLSVLVVMLESVDEIRTPHGTLLTALEWFFTILFTAEYAARVVCAPRPWRYIFSFYGLVDLLSILPSYLALLPPVDDVQRLAVIRALRLLRAFRIFKLGHMLSEASALREGIWASRRKIAVFLSFVIISVVIVGSAMHLVEEKGAGFDSIPESMYWAIVTMTTVGYGDATPQTPIGKMLAATIMMLGYSMIIVPTGIVSAEMALRPSIRGVTGQVCSGCMAEGHDEDAAHCKFCGAQL